MLSQNRILLSSLLALGAALGLVACGDDDGPATDGGGTDGGMVMMDGGPMMMDGGPTPNACDEVRAVTGEMGTTTVTGDTSMVTSRARDLGADCGNPMAARFAPQEILAYTVPGTGPIGIEFSLLNDGTDPMFDTVIQLRSTCEDIPTATDSPTCFDETETDSRSSGGTTAMGGDTLYFVVTGYSEPPSGFTDRGPWELTITARDNTAPTLTGGTMFLADTDFNATFQGMDPDGDAVGFGILFLDASGAAVDLNGDGAPDTAPYRFRFEEDLSGMMTFEGSAVIGVISAAGDTLGGILRDAGVTQGEVSLYDRVYASSATMTFPIPDATIVGLGETCDGMMTVCPRPLTCDAMVCTAPPEVVTACEGATALTITTPTTSTTSTMVDTSVAPGTGLFGASCGATGGPEVLYSLTVPTGSFDLVLNTDLGMTGDADTVVYVRSTCADPTTEVDCNDDIDTPSMMYASNLEIRDIDPGDYTIALEIYGGPMAATPVTLQASLRPVLATGASCDNAGVMNRCAGGACSGGMCP